MEWINHPGRAKGKAELRRRARREAKPAATEHLPEGGKAPILPLSRQKPEGTAMRTLLAATLALWAGTSGAATVTLDFDELADPAAPSSATVGNISYADQNHLLYGNLSPFLLLGDDGFSAFTTFTALPGTYFTPVSVDLTGFVNLLRAPCPGCSPEELLALQDDCSVFGNCAGFAAFDAFDFLILRGFRDGVLAASQGLGAGFGSVSGGFDFPAAFAGISSLTIGLTYLPPGGFPDADRYAYACGTMFFSGCLGGSVDNLTVRLNQPPGPAPVPLPAAAGVLAAGLAALVAARGRRPGVT